jgi:radical SAM protein with 4Fe4S-binding SPASM domain
MEILKAAHDVFMPVQINTTITKNNAHEIPVMAQMLEELGIVLWSVFFLIPVGRGQAAQRVSAAQAEQTFELLWQESRRRPYGIKTTEAHHYRRFVLQHQGNPQQHPGGAPPPGRIQRAPIGVNDGRGVMFVSHTGSIFPSGFMPIRCGKFPEQSIVDVYQESPLFCALREPDELKGKCGVCEYRQICGGSRARAYALTRDPLAAEPDCLYIPRLWHEKENSYVEH